MTNPNVQLLERARQQLDALSTRRTRTQVRLETEQAALQKARDEAQAQYGTSDVEELRKLLARIQLETRTAWDNFDTACKKAEQTLNDIDAALNAGSKAT